MSVLAASIADTVAGMQRVLAKQNDSSESDEPYLQPPNHGKKLKRKARYLYERHQTPKKYRKTIVHAGYTRDIISRNPKRYDEYGDELSQEEEDEKADARAAEENPYSDIKLESLLAPLTSAASLPNHPSMSIPYTSNTLGDMAQKASDMVQRERRTLSNAKILLAKLRGDETWVTPGQMETNYDASIFETKGIYETILANAPIAPSRRSSPSTSGGRTNEELPAPIKSPAMETDGVPDGVNHDSATLPASPDASQTVEPNNSATMSLPVEEDQVDDVHLLNGNNMPSENEAPSADVDTTIGPSDSNPNHQESGSAKDNVNLDASTRPGQEDKGTGNVLPSIESRQSGDLPVQEDINKEDGVDEEVEGGSNTPPRRITRAQAQADKVTASTRSASPAEWVAPPIHPLFIIPPARKPEYDFGLPPDEAQDTRLMLTAYVQKQEEVCRGAKKLYEGLLQADRQRKDVLQWCKAEGHLGEMSDGEDWYDKEEWGLDTDLKKGHVEEEEDTTVQGKKTRGRRA